MDRPYTSYCEKLTSCRSVSNVNETSNLSLFWLVALPLFGKCLDYHDTVDLLTKAHITDASYYTILLSLFTIIVCLLLCNIDVLKSISFFKQKTQLAGLLLLQIIYFALSPLLLSCFHATEFDTIPYSYEVIDHDIFAVKLELFLQFRN